jgi:predicted enzyme related to lactoylglutathione lyase
MLSNAISWFEIPVADFARARKFFETIFDYTMPVMMMDDRPMGILLYDQPAGKVGGAIVQRPDFFTPSANGTLIYLTALPDIQTVLDRIEPAGGTILTGRSEVAPGMGYWALFTDTEGNRLALHGMD